MIKEHYSIEGVHSFARKKGAKPSTRVLFEQQMASKFNQGTDQKIKEEDFEDVLEGYSEYRQGKMHDAFQKQSQRKKLHNHLLEKQSDAEKAFYA